MNGTPKTVLCSSRVISIIMQNVSQMSSNVRKGAKLNLSENYFKTVGMNSCCSHCHLLKNYKLNKITNAIKLQTQ